MAIKEMEKFFDELVPAQGKADTVAGEIVRAFARINYRFYNDGDMVNDGYGKETCNAAARYLIKHTNDNIADIVIEMWNTWNETAYRESLENLEIAVFNYINANPELKTTANKTDFWDYFDKYEDVDDTEEDDDYYEDYE